MNRRRACILVFILFAIHNQDAWPGSILSSKGLGMPFNHPHTRSMGMSGLSIALSDPFTMSRINPAGLFNVQNTRLSVQYFYQKNNYEDRTGKASSDYANLDGFSFVIPFGDGFTASAGLAPLTRMDYDIGFPDTLAGKAYNKSVEGEGGLNTFSFSLCYSPISNLSIGISGHYLFGKLTELWTVDYDDPAFAPSINKFLVKHWGFGFTAGLIFKPITPISVGAVFTPKIDLDNEMITTYTYKSDTTSLGLISYPSSWGVGTIFHLGDKAFIGIDYTTQNWSALRINDRGLEGTHNTYRISVGGEIQFSRDPTASYLKRIAYRWGFKYQPYFYTDPHRNTIKEHWASVGLGLPLFMNVAQVDIAVSYGRRGTIDANGLSENLFQLSLSITGGEKWFIRRY